jgi:hypothetical protein
VRISAPNFHFLSVEEFERPNSSDGERCQVLIFGVQLKEFHCRGYLLSEFCLYESFKLEKAEIEIHTEVKNTSQQSAHCMHKLLILLIAHLTIIINHVCWFVFMFTCWVRVVSIYEHKTI